MELCECLHTHSEREAKSKLGFLLIACAMQGSALEPDMVIYLFTKDHAGRQDCQWAGAMLGCRRGFGN